MAGRVVYASYEVPFPLGGIRVLSQQVELLRAAGVEAYRWTPTPGYRFSWFDDDVPTLSGMNLELAEDDVLVLPEVGVAPDHDPAPGGHKVIYSQNQYLHFLTCPDLDPYPGWSTRPALWAVSQAAVEMLGHALPDMPAHLVPNVVDTELFRPAASRVRRIAWMPRKRPIESTLLRRVLSADRRAEGVELYDIRNIPHEEVARVLSETSVFVALGAPEGEGFGLPPVEAMAGGCLVAGYAGGVPELFESPSAWRIPELETAALAHRALDLLDLPDQDEVRRAGRQWVEERFNTKTATAALVEGVRKALAMPGGAATATHPARWAVELMKHFPAAPEMAKPVEPSAAN